MSKKTMPLLAGSIIAYLILSVFYITNLGSVVIGWSSMVLRITFCTFLFLLSAGVFTLYNITRKHVCIRDHDYSIRIERGDLFNVSNGRVVIDFDEYFSTKDINSDSVCGQYLSKYSNTDIEDLIARLKVKPVGESFSHKHALGTVVPNGKYLLAAISMSDSREELEYTEYLNGLNRLWEQIEYWHGTLDVYMPVVGGRVDYHGRKLKEQELLDTMISSYRLSSNKMKKPNKLHIVCGDEIKLNEVFGVG